MSASKDQSPRSRSYGQFCGLARGADIIGNRWALPIVRDLLLGARRFSELQEGLPGIPPSMLSARLNELERDAVVQRVIAKPRGIKYELTDWGAELEPVITALGRWGGTRMEQPADGEVVTEAILASSLRTCFAGRRKAAPRKPVTFEVVAADIAAHATVSGNTIVVGTGPSAHPDLRIPADGRFRRLLAGRIAPSEFAAASHWTPPEIELLKLFTDLFYLPLRTTDDESESASR